MIVKNGVVTVSEGITITGFTFDGVDFPHGGMEAMYWAIGRLEDAIEEERSKLGEY